GRAQEAEAAFGDALALYKKLATDFPTVPQYRQELATNHRNLGNLLADTGRAREAEAAYGEALGLHKQLAADFPNVPDYQNDGAGPLVNLALRARPFRLGAGTGPPRRGPALPQAGTKG